MPSQESLHEFTTTSQIKNIVDVDLMEQCLSVAYTIERPSGVGIAEVSATVIAVAFYQEVRKVRMPTIETTCTPDIAESLSLKENLALLLGSRLLEYTDDAIGKLLELRSELLKDPIKPGESPKGHQTRIKRLKDITQHRGMDICYVCGNDYNCVFHHKNYTSWGKESVTDMVWLCPQCHGIVHRVIGSEE